MRQIRRKRAWSAAGARKTTTARAPLSWAGGEGASPPRWVGGEGAAGRAGAVGRNSVQRQWRHGRYGEGTAGPDRDHRRDRSQVGAVCGAWFAVEFGPRMPVVTGQVAMMAILCAPPATSGPTRTGAE
ncbi:hypothetical protein ACWGDT_41625 [Streptomyces avermitilis]